MSVNSIGTFTFLELLGNGPNIPKQIVEIIEREGVAGSSLKLLGIKGRPFSVISRVDTEDIAAAQTLWATGYATLIGGGTFEMVWRDVTILGVGFCVIDVNPLVVRARKGDLVGGLNSPSEGWLEAEWVLLPIPAV